MIKYWVGLQIKRTHLAVEIDAGSSIAGPRWGFSQGSRSAAGRRRSRAGRLVRVDGRMVGQRQVQRDGRRWRRLLSSDKPGSSD